MQRTQHRVMPWDLPQVGRTGESVRVERRANSGRFFATSFTTTPEEKKKEKLAAAYVHPFHHYRETERERERMGNKFFFLLLIFCPNLDKLTLTAPPPPPPPPFFGRESEWIFGSLEVRPALMFLLQIFQVLEEKKNKDPPKKNLCLCLSQIFRRTFFFRIDVLFF